MEYFDVVNEKDEVIVTRNGHPYAILQRINDDELEDFIIAKHLNLNNEFKVAQKEHLKDQTMNARDLLEQLNNE